MRLRAWQLSPNRTHFAYGGEEVDLSVWDVERGFSEPVAKSEQVLAAASAKKRKKGHRKIDLLHGEVWRARNVRIPQI
jgi:ribosome biogenesis protein NSA1